MKLKEAVCFEESNPTPMVITEEMLTESFMENTLKPKLTDLFTSKLKKRRQYRQRYEQKMEEYKRELTQLGVDGNEVEAIARRKARGINPENLEKSVFKKQWKEMIAEIKEKGFRNLTTTILLLIAIFHINSFFVGMFVSALGAEAGMVAAAVFLAPVTEETGRFISIKNRDGGRFNLLFNIGEYTTYMLQASSYGLTLPVMGIVRLLPVITHSFLAAVTRNQIMSGSKVPLLKAGLLHALMNYVNIGGTLVTTGAIMQKDKSSETDITEILAIGTNGSTESDRDARQEVIARGYPRVYIQDTLTGTYGADLIGADIYRVSEEDIISQIKIAKKEERSVFVIDNDLLITRNKIRRYLNKKIEFEIMKSEEGQLEA